MTILSTVAEDKLTVSYTGEKLTVQVFNQSSQMMYSEQLDFESGYQYINTSNFSVVCISCKSRIKGILRHFFC